MHEAAASVGRCETTTSLVDDTCSSRQASPKHIAKNAGPFFFFVRGSNDASAGTTYTGMTRCFYFVFSS